jgi:hypothetical protein
VAKPVLYFHRSGEGALVFDLEVRLPNGRVVEHWPNSGVPDPAEVITWGGVTVQEGTCAGSRYPSLAEPPCSTLTDGCEAAALREVETADGDCVFHPQAPPPGGPTQAWNHLFYRGEVRGTPAFPLRLEPQPDGTLRVTAIGTEPIPGRLIRLHHPSGSAADPDGAIVVAPPAPGQSLVVPSAAAAGGLATGANELGGSLRAAGLTDAETGAFRRSWDTTLFGSTVVATVTTIPPVAAMPMVPPTPSSSVLYVLPLGSADALATLRFTPAPSAIRRAIVAWVDEPQPRTTP